jgi:hypothetical protein
MITHRTTRRSAAMPPHLLRTSKIDNDEHADDEDDDIIINAPINPYADPNYPNLEFVNYDDPEYSADRSEYSDDGSLDDDDDDNLNYSDDRTLIEIEVMREERRKKNDEYQFETYHANVLRGGERCLGEWTVFQTDTFLTNNDDGNEETRKEDGGAVPRLVKWDKVLKVVSRGTKIILDPNTSWRVDGERIVHEERLACDDDFPTLMMIDNDDTNDTTTATTATTTTMDNNGLLLNWDSNDISHVENNALCCPNEMTSLDFRGPGGNMCVGKAYTVCDAIPLVMTSSGGGDVDASSEQRHTTAARQHEGPFREMRTELGVQENGMRFRVKLDYSVLQPQQIDDVNSNDEVAITPPPPPPPLHLRTLTVCRETLDGYWPSPSDNDVVTTPTSSVELMEGMGGDVGTSVKARRDSRQSEITHALFGLPRGAPGGLYDPPPVGSEERAMSNYMLLDFEGGATLLLPHRLDQHCWSSDDVDEEAKDSSSLSSSAAGWVTSLDWTPGSIRYQVDRKVLGGTKLKGLRTLELSEVQGEDAERWRPRDGGSNMRQ